MAKFGYTIIYASDVNETPVFFEKTLGMKRRFMTQEEDYGELETGETTLAFASHELGESNFSGGYISGSDSQKPLGTEIALVVDDVQIIHDTALKHGSHELKAPEQKPWGQVVSYLRAPSGVLIELCTPMAK